MTSVYDTVVGTSQPVRRYLAAVAFVLVFVLAFVSVYIGIQVPTVSAQTTSVESLQALVLSLTQKLSQLQAQGAGGTTSSVGAAVLTRPLGRGMSGSDVTALQDFLIAKGLLASGSNSGFFGALTEQAVKVFQQQNGLEAVGSVGPRTRALINGLMGSSNPSTKPTNAGSATATFTRTIGRGMSGSDVTALQDFLIMKGLLASGNNSGFFGALTEQAVKAFQQQNGLEAVGSVGQLTRQILNSTVAGSQPSAPSGSSNAGGVPSTVSPVSVGGTSQAAIITNYTPSGGGGSGGGGGSSGSGTPGGGNGNGSGGGNTTNPPNWGNGPFASYFANGTFSIPAGDVSTGASYIKVQNDTDMSISSHKATLKGGTQITNAAGGTIDVTSLTTASENPASMTPPDPDTVPLGLVQWGLPGTELSMNPGVTITFAVGSALNGDTLDAYRAESPAGPWTQTGITTPTCTVANGMCEIAVTKASRFAVSKKKPTVSLSAAPTAVASGGSATLTWSSSRATTCTASNGWTGAKAVSGSEVTAALTTTSTFTLTCTNSAGSAAASVTITVTGVAPDTTAPTAPTNLAGTATSPTQISLTWTASADAVGVTGYRVFRGAAQVGTPSTNSYIDTGLTASTAYTYTVKAIDAAGNLSPASSAVAVTTQALPAPTATLSANPASIVAGSASTLTWSSTNATSCTGTNFTPAGTSGSVSVSPAVTTTYSITCTGAGGSVSRAATVTVAAADTTPPSVTITAPTTNLAAGTTQTTLAVATNEAASCGYSTAASTAYGSMTAFTTTGNTAHAVTLSGLQDSATYTYYVKCRDTAGNISGNASVTFAVVAAGDTTPPSVPTGLTATVSSN